MMNEAQVAALARKLAFATDLSHKFDSNGDCENCGEDELALDDEPCTFEIYSLLIKFGTAVLNEKGDK